MLGEIYLKRIHIDSSYIEYITYDKSNEIVEIKYMNGNLYHYYKIPKEVYEDIIYSEDIEKSTRKILIEDDKYEYEKIW